MPLLPADFTQPSLQTILRINLDGTPDDVDIPVISEPIITQTTYERRKTA